MATATRPPDPALWMPTPPGPLRPIGRFVSALWRQPLARELSRVTGERPAACGAIGTTVLTLSAFFFANLTLSSWPGDIGWLAAARELSGVRVVAICVAVLAMGVLALTWIGVGRGLLGGGGDPRAVARYAVAWAAPLLVAPPMFSNDAWSYAAQGVVAARGLDPYVFGPAVLNGPITEAVSGVWIFTPAPYGPLGIVAGEVAGFVTSDPFVLVLWLRLFAVLGLVLVAFAVPRLARWTGADPAVAMWLVVANPAVLAHFIAGAHNDSFMVGVSALAVVAAVGRRWVVGALLVGVAASIKAPGALALVGVAGLAGAAGLPLSQRLRRVARVGAIAVAAMWLIGEVTRLGLGWVSVLGVPAVVENALSVSTNLGRLGGGLLSMAGLPGSEHATTVGRVAGVVIAALIVVWLALRTTPRSAVRDTGLAMLAVVVLGPVVYPWYLLWCLPFLGTQRLGRRGVTVLAWASVLLTVTAPLHATTADAVATTATVVVLVLMVGAAMTSRLLTLVPDNALLGARPGERVAAGSTR